MRQHEPPDQEGYLAAAGRLRSTASHRERTSSRTLGFVRRAATPIAKLLVAVRFWHAVRVSALTVDDAAALLAAHKLATPFPSGSDWDSATSHGTPYGHRNVARRCAFEPSHDHGCLLARRRVRPRNWTTLHRCKPRS